MGIDDGVDSKGKVMVEDSVLAGMRAQEILKPLLLRRTKATKRVSSSL